MQSWQNPLEKNPDKIEQNPASKPDKIQIAMQAHKWQRKNWRTLMKPDDIHITMKD